MKNLNLKIVMIGFIALATVFGSVGCSKDKKGNSSYSGYGYGGYGYGTGGNAFRAFGNEPSGKLQLGLEFGIVGQSGPYSQVQAGGELHVIQGIPCNSPYGAGLAGGVWSIRTIQPTLMTQDGLLQNMIVEAQGPNGIARISIENGTIFAHTPKRFSCSGAPGFDELSAMVRIESINNMACNATFAIYTYQSANVCGGY